MEPTLAEMMQQIEDRQGYDGLRSAITHELLDSQFTLTTAEAVRRVWRREVDSTPPELRANDYRDANDYNRYGYSGI